MNIFFTPEGILVLSLFLQVMLASLLLQLGCLIVRVKVPSALQSVAITAMATFIGGIVMVAVYLFASIAVQLMDRENPDRMALILSLCILFPADLYATAWVYKASLENASFERCLLIGVIQLIGLGLFSVLLMFLLGSYLIVAR